MSSLHSLADALADGWRDGHALAHTRWVDVLTLPAEAYAVQQRLADRLGWSAPEQPRFWKSGGGSRDAALAHAALPAERVRQAADDGADLSGFVWHAPKLEAEVAFRLGRDVTPVMAAAAANAAPDEALGWIDAMAVSIEIADSRWADPAGAGPLLRLADLASHGALGVGPWLPFAPRDWAAQRCEVRVGDDAPETFSGGYLLRDPTWLLPGWLAHATREGATLPRGSAVTTGSWCGAIAAGAARRFEANFPGIGSLAVRW